MTPSGGGTVPALRRAARRGTREALATSLGVVSRLTGRLTHDDEVRWLIVLTMPNSGSTAMAQVLATAPGTTGLTSKYEGEWLVPSLSRRPRAWNGSHTVWGPKLRATWLWAARRHSPGGETTVIEKSPSNMVRHRWLEELLSPMQVRFLVLVRDPYAVCASWYSRYGAANSSIPRRPDDARDLMGMLGRLYLDRLAHLRHAADSGIPVVRYEDFVDQPSRLVATASRLYPCFAAIDPDVPLSIKDYEVRGLQNMNASQIERLDTTHVDDLTAALTPGAPELEAFGYRPEG